ncbi:hypothetical protein [Nocardia harenae]|uniref:hypothetical protein n=1 Tax=Nocardia harenae TaxID=358707 RepID=UPI000AB5A878|nr:hypothetical protein [Nocardia harenae]
MRQPRRVRITDIVALESRAAILTEEEGTVSGELDLSLDESGHGLVRYRGTEKWYRIGNLDAEPPCTWVDLAALVSAVNAALGERDFAGNVIPFEAPAAGPDDPVGGSSAPDGGSDGAAADASAAAPAEGGADAAAAPEANPAPADAGTPAAPADGGTEAAAAPTASPDGGADAAPATGQGSSPFAGASGQGSVTADEPGKPHAGEQN